VVRGEKEWNGDRGCQGNRILEGPAQHGAQLILMLSGRRSRSGERFNLD
jgi:hypothetical protein